MLISKERKFIFIHVYKNAGTSITAALKTFAQARLPRLANRALRKLKLPSPFYDIQPFHPHVTASEMIDAMGWESFDSFFSFAFVRNPWDWQVSLYKYMLKEPTHHQHEQVKELGSFDEYIRWRCDNEVRYQKDFIYSPDGERLVDFVGRYERIDADFSKIGARIGVSVSLPKRNVSNTQPYRQFYGDETRELIREAFKPDIELFEYEF